MQPIGMAEPTGAFEVVTDWNTIRHNSEGEPGPSNNRNHICRLQVPEHPSYLVSSRKLLSIVNRKNNRVLLCRNIFVPVSGSSKIYFKNNFSTPGTFLKRIKRSSGLLCRNIFVPVSGSSLILIYNNFSTLGTFLKRRYDPPGCSVEIVSYLAVE